MSIRLRLTLWYTGILFVALAAFAVVIGQQIVQSQYKDLDITLSNRALVASAEIVIYTTPAESVLVQYPEQRQFDRLTGGDVRIQLVDNQGVGRQRSGNLDEYLPISPADIAAMRRGNAGYRWYRTNTGETLYAYVSPLILDDRFYGVVVAAKSIEPTNIALRQTLLGLAAGTLGMSLLLALIVYAVAKNALRPITRIARDAAGIQKAQDLSRRVAVPKTGDEVAAMGRTFNEMLARLEEAFEAQRRFIADASHELRTPLTAIRGNADILRRHADLMDADERAEILEEVSGEAERMSRLVNDLLTLARAQAGEEVQSVPVRLDEALDGAVRTARGLARGHEISYSPATAPVWVLGEADRLKQVMLILLDNAIKYTPPEGHIWVWLRPVGEQIELRIADDGPGVPADRVPHLFERFYRGGTPARGRDDGGAGLGLAIAREIVQGLGGTIGVESSLGHGTAFVVRFPRLDLPNDTDADDGGATMTPDPAKAAETVAAG